MKSKTEALDSHHLQLEFNLVWASVLEKHASNGLKNAAKTNNSGMSRQQRKRNNQGKGPVRRGKDGAGASCGRSPCDSFLEHCLLGLSA